MTGMTAFSARAPPGEETVTKLNALSSQFNNFFGDLEEETAVRKKAEDSRVARIERELGRLEKAINIETRRRIEATKALQVQFEERLDGIQAAFREQIKSNTEALHAEIAALNDKIGQLEVRMDEERENREREIQRHNKDVLDKFDAHTREFEIEKASCMGHARERGVFDLEHVLCILQRFGEVKLLLLSVHNRAKASLTLPKQDCQSLLRLHAARSSPHPARNRRRIPLCCAEQVTRLEREAQLLKRIGDEAFRIQQKIAQERIHRDGEMVQMKDEFWAATKTRDKADEVFKSEMLRKMAVVQRELDVETKARELSEEQLVNAINDYTKSLQEGLHVINRTRPAD